MDIGVTIVSSEFVDDHAVFVVDMSTVRSSGWQAEASPVWPSRLYMHMRITGKEQVIETNPLYWSQPSSLRELLRCVRTVMGYSYRKAAGRLRYYERITAIKLEGFSS